MKYERVEIIHGPLEKGRDLIFHESDRALRSIWRGVQVKAQPVSGSLSLDGGLWRVLTQLEAALKSELLLPTGEHVRLGEIWLFTPFPISQTARQIAQAKLHELRGVHIFDGPAFADLVEKYLPALDQMGSKPVEEYLNNLIAYCDSPEEYLSKRVQIKYAISDIYVPPKCDVRLLTDTGLRNLRNLDTALGIQEFRSRIPLITKLFWHHALPMSLTRVMLSYLGRLCDLSERISAIDWYPATGLAKAVAQLSECLTNRSHSIESDAIKEFQATAAHSFTIDHVIEFGGLFANCDPANNSAESRKFYEDLRQHPELYITLPQEFPALDFKKAISLQEKYYTKSQLEKYLVERFPPTDESDRLTKKHLRLVDQIRLFLEDFDSTLREHFPQLWMKFTADTPSNIDTGDLQSIDNLCQLGEIASLITSTYPSYQLEAFTFDATSLLQNSPRTVCLGNLGMGKSILLRRVCVSLAGVAKIQADGIPILCNLSTLVDSEAEFETSIKKSAQSAKYLEEPQNKCSRWLLDGFDEVQSPELKRRVLQWCSDAADKKIPVVIASRPSAVSAPLKKFLTVHLRLFTEDQIQMYIDRFPWLDPEQRDKMKSLMSSPSGRELLELSHTPILLTMISLVAVTRGPERLPTRRDELYTSIVDLFLGEWDAVRGVKRHQSIPDKGTRSMLLEQTSFALYEKRKRAFSRQEFISICSKSSPAKQVGLDQDVIGRFFDELLRDCLIVALSTTTYGFFHFSIQEFLAARDLNRDIGSDRVNTAIVEYFRSEDYWWEEVLVFYAGLKRDVTPLLKSLHQNLTDAVHANHPALRRLIQRWLEVAELTDTNPRIASGSVKDCLKKLGYIEQ